jgi:hypothetical protein
MSLHHGSPQPSLQLGYGFPRRAVREERGVDLLGRMHASAADYHTLTIFFPLED